MSNNNANERLYQIALTLLPHAGSVLAKNLMAYCGSAESVFKTTKGKLEKIPMIGKERAEAIADAIANGDILKQAEKELAFVEKYNIAQLFYTDKGGYEEIGRRACCAKCAGGKRAGLRY